MIEATWGTVGSGQHFETDVEVFADARTAPIRQVLDVFSNEKLRVTATTTHRSGRHLRIVVTVEIDALEHLDRLIAALVSVEGVLEVRRR